MRASAVRRLLMVIPTLFLVTVLVFLSVRFLPGDVIDVMQMQMERSWSGLGHEGIDRAAMERRLGLDVPVYVQYGRWVGGIVLRGTLGQPLMGGDTVDQSIAERLPVTVQLGLMANRHRAGDRRAGRYLLGDPRGGCWWMRFRSGTTRSCRASTWCSPPWWWRSISSPTSRTR